MEGHFLEEYKIVPPAISTAGVYFFTTDSGVVYEVRFGRRQDNILHATIVFGVLNDEYDGEEYTVTNRGGEGESGIGDLKEGLLRTSP